MSSMQIDLYSALTGANIDADKAKVVVESLQEHIDMQVSRANEAVLAKLDGVQMTLVAKIDALISGRIEPIEKAVGQLHVLAGDAGFIGLEDFACAFVELDAVAVVGTVAAGDHDGGDAVDEAVEGDGGRRGFAAVDGG